MGWRSGGHYIGLGLILTTERDLKRVGHCWMEGRLKVGDMILCLKHSGDCFWDYCLIERKGKTIDGKHVVQLLPQATFGAYVLGTPIKQQPTEREVHLLLAGEQIEIPGDRNNLEKTLAKMKALSNMDLPLFMRS